MAIEHITLVSTNLESADYDHVEHTLAITFNNGGRYTYFTVPVEIFEGLRSAPSAGQFFHHHIRERFMHQRT